MTVSVEKIVELASKAGLDLTGRLTRSEMKRVVLHHYDEKHRKAYAEGLRDLVWVTQADTDLLDALEVNSFKKP